ncbi:PilZ domain-containing protein [Pseudomonas costantinii]|uniref:PilZ domain-containing protein n=1 Tax=Pseudomonas costantinii TaxID=168469 RepID=A0A1S2UBT5_9PSED|nr:PilZ domain-containing protein [Pseudomonas costantinii]NVZ20553.1 PilZ domain-containing protein [Pseudomonas costantinii]OIN43378.1 pilus assembly protein PilZ [Pseudomonas costantinii]SEE37176.1 PilZ domain-containing protein [Pseudomonas costantinii]
MGRFLPHPDDVAALLIQRPTPAITRQRLHTIGLGGVACNCPRAWRQGTAVDLRIPSLGASARYPGYVAWCRKVENGYRIGISFTDEHALFGARMGEQVCQIERYCRLHEDVEPTAEQLEVMAREWVSLHAGEFSHEAFVQPVLD